MQRTVPLLISLFALAMVGIVVCTDTSRHKATRGRTREIRLEVLPGWNRSAKWEAPSEIRVTDEILDPLFRDLHSQKTQIREDAAEELAELLDPRISDPLRNRLKVENDFHVQLALHKALASQGEKAATRFLINSLRRSGHLGCVYLRDVSGEDFGWNIQKYEDWFRTTSDADFRTMIEERWREKPMMQEWGEFVRLFQRGYFSGFHDDEAEVDEFSEPMTRQDEARLSEMPTARAWRLFDTALGFLQSEGDRKTAAQVFRRVATEYSDTYYAGQALELADQLDRMVMEDEQFKQPGSLNRLTTEQKIAIHIHNLRDVEAHQYSQPGYCSVFNLFSLSRDRKPTAAEELLKIGSPAVPHLQKLLDDRRPIRGVGYWRDFHPTRTVLRYQDAAIQIISAIQQQPHYKRRTTSSYFSNESPEVRQSVQQSIEDH